MTAMRINLQSSQLTLVDVPQRLSSDVRLQRHSVKRGRAQLHCGDCLEGMKGIPSESVDLVLCDPPYGFGATKNKWDSALDFNEMWAAYDRICKPNAAIILFAGNKFKFLLVASNMERFKYEIIWRKNAATDFLNASKKPLAAHETVLVFSNDGGFPCYNVHKMGNGKPYVRDNTRLKGDRAGRNYGGAKKDIIISDGGRYPTTVVDFDKVAAPFHPTQKPVELLAWLVSAYSNEGDVVLDNCMGSGSTGVAAIAAGRDFIGIEKEEEYFDYASERIGALIS